MQFHFVMGIKLNLNIEIGKDPVRYREQRQQLRHELPETDWVLRSPEFYDGSEYDGEVEIRTWRSGKGPP